MRQSLVKRGLSDFAIDIVLASWRGSTKKQYLSYLHRWLTFCTRRSLDCFTIETAHILDFLSELYSTGLAYSAINMARSAISAFLGVAGSEPVGSQALVIRFMKGVARNRPSKPRYNCIWDVNCVFTMFRMQPLVEFISLCDLTLRTVMLLSLVSAQRGQSLHLLDIDAMCQTADSFTFYLQGDFKQSRVGHEHLEIVLPAYKGDIRLCIVHTLSVYLNRTKDLRGTSKLLISTVRPHKQVSKATIGRWIKQSLKMAGIDTNTLKSHSTRAAATSAAQRKGVKIAEILKVAGWSNETTFAKFYNKPLQPSTSNAEFAEAVLKS